MAYISRMIAEGEKLIGVSRLHWIYLVEGLCWLIGLMCIGFVLDGLIAKGLGVLSPVAQWHFIGLQATGIELFFIAAGLYLFAIFFIKVATTEVALTTQRIIHKTGWIFVKVKEVNLEEIKGSRIDLGMLGRFLGYGSIALDARFVQDANLPFINKPYRFVKAMNEAQEALEDHLSLVIDGQEGTVHLRPAEKETAAALKKKHREDPKPEAVDTRPQAQPHEVAEGSFEEEKLSEDLNREWDEHADSNAHRTSRQIH